MEGAQSKSWPAHWLFRMWFLRGFPQFLQQMAGHYLTLGHAHIHRHPKLWHFWVWATGTVVKPCMLFMFILQYYQSLQIYGTAWQNWIIKNWKGFWGNQSWPSWRSYTNLLEGVEENNKKLNHDRECVGQDSNQAPN